MRVIGIYRQLPAGSNFNARRWDSFRFAGDPTKGGRKSARVHLSENPAQIP